MGKEDYLSQDEDSNEYKGPISKGKSRKRKFSEDSNYFSDDGEKVLRNLMLFISKARSSPVKKTLKSKKKTQKSLPKSTTSHPPNPKPSKKEDPNPSKGAASGTNKGLYRFKDEVSIR